MNMGGETAMRGTIKAVQNNIAGNPGRKWLILSTVLLGATMSALDLSIVNVAMPTLKSTFGVSMAVIEWITMAYMLTLTIFLPLFGRLADIYGRSRLYNIGFVVFSVGSLFCGISTSAGLMIAARVIQGIGAGLLQANSVALITEAFPHNERGKAIGVQGAVQAIAMSVGPFVGGILIATVGWRVIFYVNIPIGIIGTLAGLLILPANRKVKSEEKVDYLGTALFSAGLASIVLAFNEVGKMGWGSQVFTLYLLAGLVLLALFVMAELKSDSPLIDLKLFKNATFLIGNLTGMLSYYVLFAIMFLMPFYLEKVLGYNVALTGLLITPLLLAMAVVAPFSGYISDKYGPRIMTTSGMLMSTLACLALLFTGAAASIPLLAGIMIFMGSGIGLFIPSNNSATMDSAPADKLGMAGGLLNMTRSLGLILGVDISGGIFTTLEHQYLAEKGFPNAQNIFSNTTIPVLVKDTAFMHGFMMVIMILLGATVVSAGLSAARGGGRVSIVDHERAGSAVISSGFFNWFDQETHGMSVFIMLLLCTGVFGLYTSSRLRHGESLLPHATQSEPLTPQSVNQNKSVTAAEKLALAYYVDRYHDADVRIEVKPLQGQTEADVLKYGILVDRLSIKGNAVSEIKSGISYVALDLMTNVN
jgi:EmrB/QacA subfamily drug resistance transporter